MVLFWFQFFREMNKKAQSLSQVDETRKRFRDECKKCVTDGWLKGILYTGIAFASSYTVQFVIAKIAPRHMYGREKFLIGPVMLGAAVGYHIVLTETQKCKQHFLMQEKEYTKSQGQNPTKKLIS